MSPSWRRRSMRRSLWAAVLALQADSSWPLSCSCVVSLSAWCHCTRASLVAVVRKEAEPARKAGREALAAHDVAKLARHEERLVTALNAAFDS